MKKRTIPVTFTVSLENGYQGTASVQGGVLTVTSSDGMKKAESRQSDVKVLARILLGEISRDAGVPEK